MRKESEFHGPLTQDRRNKDKAFGKFLHSYKKQKDGPGRRYGQLSDAGAPPGKPRTRPHWRLPIAHRLVNTPGTSDPRRCGQAAQISRTSFFQEYK